MLRTDAQARDRNLAAKVAAARLAVRLETLPWERIGTAVKVIHARETVEEKARRVFQACESIYR